MMARHGTFLSIILFCTQTAYGQQTQPCAYDVAHARSTLLNCLKKMEGKKLMAEFTACLQAEATPVYAQIPNSVIQSIQNIPVHKANLTRAINSFDQASNELTHLLIKSLTTIQNKQKAVTSIAAQYTNGNPDSLFPLTLSPAFSAYEGDYYTAGMDNTMLNYSYNTIEQQDVQYVAPVTTVGLENLGYGITNSMSYYYIMASPITQKVYDLQYNARILLSRLAKAASLYSTLSEPATIQQSCINTGTSTLLNEIMANTPSCAAVTSAATAYTTCINKAHTQAQALINGAETVSQIDSRLNDIISGSGVSIKTLTQCPLNGLKKPMNSLISCMNNGDSSCPVVLPWRYNAQQDSGNKPANIPPIAKYQPKASTLNDIPQPSGLTIASESLSLVNGYCTNVIPAFPGNGQCTYTSTPATHPYGFPKYTAACTAHPVDEKIMYGGTKEGAASVQDCTNYMNFISNLQKNITSCTGSITHILADRTSVIKNLKLLTYFSNAYFTALNSATQCSSKSCNNNQLCMQSCKDTQASVAVNFVGMETVINNLVAILLQYYPNITQGAQLPRYTKSISLYNQTINYLEVPGYPSPVAFARVKASTGQQYLGKPVQPDSNGYIYPAQLLAADFLSATQSLIDNVSKAQAAAVGWYADVYGMTKDQWKKQFGDLTNYHTGSSGCGQFFSSQIVSIMTALTQQIISVAEQVALTVATAGAGEVVAAAGEIAMNASMIEGLASAADPNAPGLSTAKLITDMTPMTIVNEPTAQSFNQSLAEITVRSVENAATVVREDAQAFGECMKKTPNKCGSQFGSLLLGGVNAFYTGSGLSEIVQTLINQRKNIASWAKDLKYGGVVIGSIVYGIQKLTEKSHLVTQTSPQFYGVGSFVGFDVYCKSTCVQEGWQWKHSKAIVSQETGGVRQVSCTCGAMEKTDK